MKQADKKNRISCTAAAALLLLAIPACGIATADHTQATAEHDELEIIGLAMTAPFELEFQESLLEENNAASREPLPAMTDAEVEAIIAPEREYCEMVRWELEEWERIARELRRARKPDAMRSREPSGIYADDGAHVAVTTRETFQTIGETSALKPRRTHAKPCAPQGRTREPGPRLSNYYSIRNGYT